MFRIVALRTARLPCARIGEDIVSLVEEAVFSTYCFEKTGVLVLITSLQWMPNGEASRQTFSVRKFPTRNRNLGFRFVLMDALAHLLTCRALWKLHQEQSEFILGYF